MAKENIFLRFESTLQFAKYIDDAKTSATFAKQDLSSMRKGKSTDCECASLEEAQSRLKSGDRANFDKIKKILSTTKMVGTGTSTRTKNYADVVGFVPHVPNFCANVPQQMINQRCVRHKNSKVLNVLWNPTTSWNVESEEMLKVASGVLSEIYSAEKRGYRINLYVTLSSEKGGQNLTTLIKVKDASQYMDLAKVVYPMVNPMLLRRQFFRVVETQDVNNSFIGTYGSPIHRKEDIMKYLPKNFKMDYYYDFYTEHSRHQEIK